VDVRNVEVPLAEAEQPALAHPVLVFDLIATPKLHWQGAIARQADVDLGELGAAVVEAHLVAEQRRRERRERLIRLDPLAVLLKRFQGLAGAHQFDERAIGRSRVLCRRDLNRKQHRQRDQRAAED
jgi:hypothetical protein